MEIKYANFEEYWESNEALFSGDNKETHRFTWNARQAEVNKLNFANALLGDVGFIQMKEIEKLQAEIERLGKDLKRYKRMWLTKNRRMVSKIK